jgi:hypothetical protein
MNLSYRRLSAVAVCWLLTEHSLAFFASAVEAGDSDQGGGSYGSPTTKSASVMALRMAARKSLPAAKS